MGFFAGAAFLVIAAGLPAAAQTAGHEIALGDSAYAVLNASQALIHYERAASLDTTSYEAAWKASRGAADLEMGARGRTEQHARLLEQAERFARRAIALRPNAPEGHFSLARALGLAARSVSVRQRVRYANAIRDHALECLRYDPEYSGCMHVMGAWNAEVMRLGGVERFLARRLLGGRAFASASWEAAVRYLEEAVATDSTRIAHRAELAEVYLSVGRTADARKQYEAVLQLNVRDYADEAYKAQARQGLRRIG